MLKGPGASRATGMCENSMGDMSFDTPSRKEHRATEVYFRIAKVDPCTSKINL